MKPFYDVNTPDYREDAPAASPDLHGVGLADASRVAPHTAVPGLPHTARLEVYDGLTAPPRVEDLARADARALIEDLTTRTYQLSHEAGGSIPYTVIREVVENLIHADFSEVVVSVCDRGDTLRFSDQGPGVRDKERVFMPGFSTATEEMKRVIKGVGSGLPVAKECLGFSGGTITLEDNLGRGTVVTLRLERAQPPVPVPAAEPLSETAAAPDPAPARLTLRQKQVLSIVMELGAVGPSVVSRELGVGLSTAYRDLSALEDAGLIASDESGKRVLTTLGITSLDRVLTS